MDTVQILKQLKQERQRLDRAIAALEALNGSSNPVKVHGGTSFIPAEFAPVKRKMSAAGRARIAAAAKARWARIKAGKARHKIG